MVVGLWVESLSTTDQLVGVTGRRRGECQTHSIYKYYLSYYIMKNPYEVKDRYVTMYVYVKDRYVMYVYVRLHSRWDGTYSCLVTALCHTALPFG